MPPPFISIVTPTKNSADSIEKTIKSVLIQKSESIEHIIIDSNSTDDTIKIVQQYEKRYPLKFISEEDVGISDAFNKGIKLSIGKWIIFLGSGDQFVDQNILSEIAGDLNKRENELIAWGDVVHVDNNGNHIRHISGNIKKKTLKRYMCIPHQATFHHRKLFKNYGMFDESLKTAMDYDLCLRAYNEINITVGYLNKTISYMLTGGVSQTGIHCLKEFMEVQYKNDIYHFQIFPKLLYAWAIVKKKNKMIILCNFLTVLSQGLIFTPIFFLTMSLLNQKSLPR